MTSKTIPNTDGRYIITNDGHVYDMVKGREISQHNCRGYRRVSLVTTYGRRKFYVHRLVAEAFVSGRSTERSCVNHLDGNRANNCEYNLAWASVRENNMWNGGNVASAVARGKPVIALDPITRKGVGAWWSIREASRVLGIDARNISRCLHGQQKTCGGCMWRWAK